MSLESVIPNKRNPSEEFLISGRSIGFTVGDFWSAAFSDLLTNMNRGVLAEFLVLNSLGLTDKVMNDIAEVDAVLESGIKIEVKSSGYLQRWRQTKPSTIRFSIESKLRFDYELNDFAPEPAKRHSDLYVFALYAAMDKSIANPTNLDDWQFYCVATASINSKKPHGKSISLNELLRVFAPKACGYPELRSEIQKLERSILSGGA